MGYTGNGRVDLYGRGQRGRGSKTSPDFKGRRQSAGSPTHVA